MLADVRRLLTPKWLLFHAVVWAAVAGMLVLGWWQVNRAAGGNALSFGYAIQWPAFAGFVIFIWVREMRRTLRPPEPAGPAEPDSAEAAAPPTRSAAVRRTRPAPRTGPAYDDSDDEQLAEYNRYLAWLNANPQATPADYPG